MVKPSDAVLRREFRADRLSAEERAYWKEHVFDELLVRIPRDAQPINAIQEEQREFAAAVRTGKVPRVDGAAGRDAVDVDQPWVAVDDVADRCEAMAALRVGVAGEQE